MLPLDKQLNQAIEAKVQKMTNTVGEIIRSQSKGEVGEGYSLTQEDFEVIDENINYHFTLRLTHRDYLHTELLRKEGFVLNIRSQFSDNYNGYLIDVCSYFVNGFNRNRTISLTSPFALDINGDVIDNKNNSFK